ncbi:hypothetical protein LPW26_19205 [Rhodopseudomonas sp. HC1]|uniref:hypothetical protein n=1 Tax=Rhodopseudomonas infernalis TaxID=2897386 RepID=UPI001EE990BF|nr:hypothetical protein [Rhodopseudomonas infernalis]MCG6206782.1 hypothetical protein [Rhodopseudomonas infernalis]
MATITNRLATLRDGRETLPDAEEELRVLTALIGCIMVAEDANGPHDHPRLLQHLAPPAGDGLAKAS